MVVTTAAPRRWTGTLIAAATALALALGLLAALPTSRAAAAETDDVAASAAHPYGDPVWFPLRRPADVGCAKAACGRWEAHGYWALDFIGLLDDPVYAAGAGILHIGGRGNGCAKSGSKEVEGGNWVWIDHGAGVVSRYHHLNTITATEGQLVTPATQIGTMGHSGDVEPCTINYLHFEVRHGGLKGERVDPGELFTCTPEGRVTMPAALGGTGWDDPAVHTRPRIKTLTGTDDCITPDWLDTLAAPAATVTRGSTSLRVDWAAPAGSTGTVLGLQIYRPSLGAWADLGLTRRPAGATSYRFTGLDNGRSYRVTLQLRNAGGLGPVSAPLTMVPAGKPAAPPSLRYAQWTKRDYIHYGWNRAYHNGAKVTGFTVAWRCTTKGKSYPASWKQHSQDEVDTYYNIRGLSKKSACQVKVRATNEVGNGAWIKKKTVRWGAK